MSSYNTTAIVIRRLNYSETDKILTLYSRDRGRFSAIAKGARKTVSRLSGATELLTCTQFNLATGRSMDVVTQTEVRESFTHMRSDLSRLAHGLYLADLVDHAVEDHEPNPVLFDLLMAGLFLVQRAPSPEIAARWFDLQMLQDLGYQPNLFRCAACHCDIVASPDDDYKNMRYALSASQGSVLCAAHARPGVIDDHSALTSSALFLLQSLDRIQPEDGNLVAHVVVPSGNSLDQANLALRRYLRYRLERELKSLAFLDSLRHASA
jgi:DNA repair protein RecO (recombination protein O)